MIPRWLTIQGAVGIIASLALLGLLFAQKLETRHWRKESDGYERRYRNEQSAFAETVASVRAAADQARVADRVAAERVVNAQRTINERSNDALEHRLAAARSVAKRLRSEAGATAADSGRGRAAAMPGLPAAAGTADPAAQESGFPHADRLTATEQAIQLDELIQWVKRQSSVDPNGKP